MTETIQTQTSPATTSAHAFAKSPDPVGEDRAYLDFVLGLKQHWARTLYPKLCEQYDAAVSGPGTPTPSTIDEVRPVVEQLPAYPYFGWLERNAQKMMWRRLEAMIQPQERVLAEGQNDEYLFHRRFVETAIPRDRVYSAILDLGCGFGKSTRPFVDAFPVAEVVGIDLSAPNLLLAHQQAERLQKRITFSQRPAEDTRYPDRSFDLVTGTMLIHELPMPVVRTVVQEAARLLRPGGLVAFLDFQRTGDLFRDVAMDDHGARNNEPYMPHLFRIDLSRLLERSGFERIEILPFDERGAGLVESGEWPARSEWHVPWSVIRATRTDTGKEG